MFFPVIGYRFVESDIFILSDFIWLSHPDWLHVVQVFPFVAHFLNLLSLLFFLRFVFVNFFHLWLIIITLFFLVVIFIIGNFLFGSLFSVKFDWESNEFRMLLHKILNSLFLKVFTHIFFQMKNDTSTSSPM